MFRSPTFLDLFIVFFIFDLNKFSMKSIFSRDNDTRFESISKLIVSLGLYSSFIGAIVQYVNLYLIGGGTWIIAYYSISYIMLEGLNYLIYFSLFLLTIYYSAPFLEKTAKSEKKIYRIYLGICILILCIISALLSKKLQIRTYAYPFILIAFTMSVYLLVTSFAKAEDILEEKIDGIDSLLENYSLMIITAVIFVNFFSTLKPGSFLSTDEQFYSQFPSIKNELKQEEKIKSVYNNDNYIFIKFFDKNGKEMLMIKKIEDLLNSRENSISRQPIISPKKVTID